MVFKLLYKTLVLVAALALSYITVTTALDGSWIAALPGVGALVAWRELFR